MGTRLAAATDALRGQQPFPPEQAQDTFAAHAHGVLAAQPSPDLAVALPGKRRGEQGSPDELQQVGVADGAGRPWPQGAWRAGSTGVDAGAWRTEHPAHQGQRQVAVHGCLGRFAGGIDSPSFGGSPQDLVLQGQLADLAFGLLELASSGLRSAQPMCFQAQLT